MESTSALPSGAKMAAANSDPKTITASLMLTASGSGDLLARRWRVEVVDGPDRGKEIIRDSGTVVVGSHPNVDLILTDSSVSRYHAELKLLAEGVMVIDLESKNGTIVGGVRIDRALVPPDGIVRVGKTRLKLSTLDT